MKKIVALISGIMLFLCIASPALAVSKDSTEPIVTNSHPFDSQINVMVDSKLVIRFNETVQKGRSIAMVKIKDANDKFLPYSYELKDNILQLTPKKKLNYESVYSVTIPAHAVKDTVGNDLAKEYVVDFVTESKEAADGSVVEEQEEASKSTHTIGIDAIMERALNDDAKTYLIAALRSIGVRVNSIRVSEAEEATEEKPEVTEEVTDELTEEEADEIDATIDFTQFDVYLVDAGPMKIQVIKVIREMTSLGLKGAKDLVDGVSNGPRIVMEGISSDEANQCITRLEEQRATAIIVGHGESPE